MRKYIWTIIIVCVILLFLKDISRFPFPSKATLPNNALLLIAEPSAGIAPILQLINSAKKSVDLVMYELEDKQIEQALVATEKRGVAVRVLLSSGYKGEDFDANQPAFNFLKANGVPVEWSPDYFALTHEKSLVVDAATALIMTFNFTAQYYSTSRDFGIVDKDARDVSAIEATFNNDWQGKDVAAKDGDDLVWSPGSEPAIVSLINSAKHSLDIYNEEMADPRIIAALIDAAQRGVDVNIDMTYSPEWKTAFEELTTAGAHVRTYAPDAPLYIHAKMILADDKRAFVGSENFSANSLDDNRELGIVLSDQKIIVQLANTFNEDWTTATPFQL